MERIEPVSRSSSLAYYFSRPHQRALGEHEEHAGRGEAGQVLELRRLEDVLDDEPGVGDEGAQEVAHAAVLCPSFYRAKIVLNPTWFDRALAKMRNAMIGVLQPKQRIIQPVAAE